MNHPSRHIVIIGQGAAGLAAAVSAAETVRVHKLPIRITLIDKARESDAGGNTRWSPSNMRMMAPDRVEPSFVPDMLAATDHKGDADYFATLAANAPEVGAWMASRGVEFIQPPYYLAKGPPRIQPVGGGAGLVARFAGIARAEGVDIRYACGAEELVVDGGRVVGVVVASGDKRETLGADAVVLASGGFQGNAEMMLRHFGPGADTMRLISPGTRFATGDGIRMALAIGASPCGNWSGCHAVGWDMNAPEFGDLAVGDQFQKHSYPFAIMVNATGRRFVDEGADFRNYTYAKYGAVVLRQPNNFAWQVFDGKIVPMLRDEYRIKRVSKVSANTIEEFAHKLEGVNAEAFLDEIKKYNAAVKKDVKFDPNVKDGRCTMGLAVNKSNWANTIEEPPFEAYQVGCGVSFTFGGVRIDPDSGQVIDSDMNPIPGLYAAGELVGGIFYFNYPGGSGLMSGAVFGKIAGTGAASGRNA